MVHGDNKSRQNENSTEASMPKLASLRYYGRTALFIYLPIATLLDIATRRDAELCFGGNGQVDEWDDEIRIAHPRCFICGIFTLQ